MRTAAGSSPSARLQHGDTGRKHVRISSINLRDRDGLHGRLDSVRCPVLRMHGTEDPVYSVRQCRG